MSLFSQEREAFSPGLPYSARRIDHLLERVSRTTFELFQIPHGAFTGEKFDLQLDFVIIDRYKDAVDIFLHKITVDESVHRIVAGGLQHAADLRDVCVEVGAGVLLLLKLGETAAALLNLLVCTGGSF